MIKLVEGEVTISKRYQSSWRAWGHYDRFRGDAPSHRRRGQVAECQKKSCPSSLTKKSEPFRRERKPVICSQHLDRKGGNAGKDGARVLWEERSDQQKGKESRTSEEKKKAGIFDT